MTNNADPSVAPVEPDDIVPSYGVYNGRLTYMTEDRNWTASFAVTNLFDKEYYYSLQSASTSMRAAQPGRPREWSMTLNKKF